MAVDPVRRIVAPRFAAATNENRSWNWRRASESCDAAFAEEDGVSRQSLRAIATSTPSLEDAMDALDEDRTKAANRHLHRVERAVRAARSSSWRLAKPGRRVQLQTQLRRRESA